MTFVTLAFAASVLLGIGRALDLAFGTDAATELCTVGSVWWRYAALAAAVALCVAAGYTGRGRPRRLCARRTPEALLAVLAAAFDLASAFARIYWRLSGAGAAVRVALEIACALWLLSLGRAWLRDGEWKTPTKTLIPAVLGSTVYFWAVLVRFMENSSSWHRAAQTAVVWQYMAALFFLAALARALYMPEAADSRALCAGGLCCFALCFCWQAPQTAADLLNTLQDASQTGEYFDSVALCFVGALGGRCAWQCLRSEH